MFQESELYITQALISMIRNYNFNKTECYYWMVLLLVQLSKVQVVISVSFRTVIVSCHVYTLTTAKVQFHGLLCWIQVDMFRFGNKSPHLQVFTKLFWIVCVCFKTYFFSLFFEDNDVTSAKIHSICKPQVAFWQAMHVELVT
jgi:hypothetical protein